MKMYIDNRKVGESYERAMTIYSDNGKLLYSGTGRIWEEDMLKFDKTLLSIEWAVRKFRKLSQQGIVSEDEKLIIFINSLTIYKWLEKGTSPPQYIRTFSDIQLELSLLMNETEIIYTKSSKALYKSTTDETFKVTDLF